MDGRGGNEKKKEKEKEAPGEHHDGATGGPGQPARKSPAAQAKLGGVSPYVLLAYSQLGACFPAALSRPPQSFSHHFRSYESSQNGGKPVRRGGREPRGQEAQEGPPSLAETWSPRGAGPCKGCPCPCLASVLGPVGSFCRGLPRFGFFGGGPLPFRAGSAFPRRGAVPTVFSAPFQVIRVISK
jgi:hypothetical protein